MSKITAKNIESDLLFETNPKFNADPTLDDHLSRKKYVDDNDALKVNKAGDTMSGPLNMGSNKVTNMTTGTAAGDGVNRGQMDAALEGLKPKGSADLATTANITLSGEQTIDGTLTSNSRVLVKDQTLSEDNGLYDSGSGAWTRSVDMDVSSEVKGSYVPVSGGTANQGRNFVQTGAFATLGTDAINFTFFNSALDVHTHTASEVTDFEAAVSANSSVTANTAKVSASGSVTSHSDVSNAGSGAIITTSERSKLSAIAAGAQVNVALASQAEAEAGNDNTKTMTALRTAQAIASLQGGAFKREVITLSAQNITDGYVEAANPVIANTLMVTPIGGIPQEPGVDYTESIVVTNTRITFAGDLLGLVEGEKLLITYEF